VRRLVAHQVPACRRLGNGKMRWSTVLRSGVLGERGRGPGREVYLQSRLLKRTVLVAPAQTALYLAAGLFPLTLIKEWC